MTSVDDGECKVLSGPELQDRSLRRLCSPLALPLPPSQCLREHWLRGLGYRQKDQSQKDWTMPCQKCSLIEV
jgi:hypothetical protein